MKPSCGVGAPGPGAGSAWLPGYAPPTCPQPQMCLPFLGVPCALVYTSLHQGCWKCCLSCLTDKYVLLVREVWSQLGLNPSLSSTTNQLETRSKGLSPSESRILSGTNAPSRVVRLDLRQGECPGQRLAPGKCFHNKAVISIS